MTAQSQSMDAMAIAVAAGVPVLLWGAPGTGKTSAVRALSAALDLPCEIVIASIREPSDFAGLPLVAGGNVRMAPPAWAERLAEAGGGILFLDEISTAPPAVQAALLRVVLERVVGDLPLGPDVAMVAAANPPEQAADGWELSAPLANRFCHLDWAVDPVAVAEGIMSGWPPPVPPRLPPGWEAQIPAARGLVSAFLTVRPGLALAVPSDPSRAGRAWPSPRTWEMAARLWAAAQAAGVSTEAETALVTGAVGEGAGVELLMWHIQMDLPDPETLLADPDGFEMPERGDQAYAVLSAVAAAVAAHCTPERWQAGWRILGKAGEHAPDMAAVAARTLTSVQPPGTAAPPEVRLFAPLLRDAGLL